MPAPITLTPAHGAAAAQVTSRRSDTAGSNDAVLTLTGADVDELLTARNAVRRASLPLLGVRRADFPLPSLGTTLARVAEELESGHGHLVIRGIPIARLSEADRRLVFWGLGRHLGLPVSQDALGRLVRPADTSRTDFHSGGSDVTALLVRDRGRTVSLTSTGGIVDEVIRRRPELAVRMFEDFHHDRMGEEAPGERPYRSMPLACRYEGRLSVRYDRRVIESAQRLLWVPRLAPDQRALLDLVDEVAASPDACHDVDLQPGDLLLMNNYEVLHRHPRRGTGPAALAPLRLWVTLRRGRPLPPTFTWPTPAYGDTGGRGGIAPRDVVDHAQVRLGTPATHH